MSIFCDENQLEDRKEKLFIQTLNEAYFGQTPGITRCYDAFCEFRRKYKSTKLFRGVSNIDMDHDKDLHRFCNEMERQFGFSSFTFIVQNSLESNMYTIPIMFDSESNKNLVSAGIGFALGGIIGGIICGSLASRKRATPKDFINIDKEGYHFKKEANMSCIIVAYAQMLFDANLTDEEAFAIVLHEVGHNFQRFLSNSMLRLGLVNNMIYLFQWMINIVIGLIKLNPGAVINSIENLLLSSQKSHNFLSKAFNSLTADEYRANLYTYFNFVSGILSVPTAIVKAVISVPLAPILGLVSGLSAIYSNLGLPTIGVSRYAGEQMADNFPSYYGFGRAVISGQREKMPSPFGPAVELVSDLPVIGHMYNFCMIPAEIMMNIGDEHPSSPVRCASVLNSMKTDLKDPRLSPKLRKQLEQQIKETEKDMNNYYSEAKKVKNPKLLRSMMDYSVYKRGGDVKYKASRSLFINPDEEVRNVTDELMGESVLINCKII